MSALRTRAQRRKFDRACEQAERMVEADAKFFDRFPHRSHRVRPASRSEMEANRLASGHKSLPASPGKRWFAVVKQIGPGVRARVFIENDADVEWEMDELHAEIVYDLQAKPGTQAYALEQQLRAIMAVRGAV